MFFFGRRTTKMPPPPLSSRNKSSRALNTFLSKIIRVLENKTHIFDNLRNTTIFAFFKLLQCYNESKKLNLSILFCFMKCGSYLEACPLPNLFSFTKCHYIGSHTFLFSNLLNSNPFHKCPSILIFEEEDISTHRSGV